MNLPKLSWLRGLSLSKPTKPTKRPKLTQRPQPTNPTRPLLYRLGSLQFRLPLIMLVVVTVAVGVTAFFAQQGTTGIFNQFTAFSVARDQKIVTWILSDASQSGDLSQAKVEMLGANFGQPIMLVNIKGDVLAASDPSQIGVKLSAPPEALPPIFYEAKPSYIVMSAPAAATGQPQDNLAWVDPQTVALYERNGTGGTFTVKTLPYLPATAALTADALRAEPFPGNGVAVASAPFNPAVVTKTIAGQVAQPFLSSINRAFLVSVAAALALTTVLSFGLSRRILTPVQALTDAARQLEKGDLSQRVAVHGHDEIGELAHAFNAMADGLGKADQLRRSLVSDVAHELRTPLANVRGYLEAMRDGLVQPNPATLDSLYEETLLLNRLVDDLQELALAEAGQLRLAREPLSPTELVSAAVAAAQPQAAQKGLTLRAEAQPNLPTLSGDSHRLGQALRNLITNAIAHTPTGGQITVSATLEDNALALSVHDTGEGIAAEHLPLVFERFYRVDPSRHRSTGGSGLGLAIVKQWVAAHGGTVTAQSVGIPGQGSTFTLHLPLAVTA